MVKIYLWDYFERIILKNERNVKINIQKCRLKFIHQQLIELDEISITYNVSFLIFLFYYIFLYHVVIQNKCY